MTTEVLFRRPMDEVLASLAAGLRDPDVMEVEPCQFEDPDLFFPPDERDRFGRLIHTLPQRQLEVAQAVCGRCVVADLCLERAVKRGERLGVWGGVDFARLRRQGVPSDPQPEASGTNSTTDGAPSCDRPLLGAPPAR